MSVRHKRLSHRNTTILLVVLIASVVLLVGCGGSKNEEATDQAGSSYSLDPPELAEHVPHGFESGVPVLCYHYFRARFNAGYLAKAFAAVLFGAPTLGTREFWTTPVSEFEKHLRYFRDTNTRVMTLDEVADYVTAGKPLPQRAVVLTIDDADNSVYQLAWPLLKKYGMKAHLFVPTGHVGTDWAELEICTWDQLREMSDSGAIIVGSHTRDMHFKVETPKGMEPVFWNPQQMPLDKQGHNLSSVAEQRRTNGNMDFPTGANAALSGAWAPVAADLLASRYDINNQLQTEPRWLAWPYGFAHGDLDSISQMVGFRGTVSLSPSAFAEQDSLLTPGRYTLTAKTTLTMIQEVLPPQ